MQLEGSMDSSWTHAAYGAVQVCGAVAAASPRSLTSFSCGPDDLAYQIFHKHALCACAGHHSCAAVWRRRRAAS
jgi:hypothetical protein